MVDLGAELLEIGPELDEALRRVFSTARYIGGEEVRCLEEELATYLDVAHVICVANGTDALMLSLMALGLHPGDEVIVPDFTFFATAEAAAFLGLRPIFVDVEPVGLTMDPDAVRRAITPKTRAIIPVHLFGQSADIPALLALAQAHGLALIEDTAQALGARIQLEGRSQAAGTIGQLGTTSFFPSKPLGCYGDGGAILTHDPDLAQHVRMLANHGAQRKYFHEHIGVNSRLDALQAAILRVKLRHLDQWAAHRQAVALRYDQGLGDIEELRIPRPLPQRTHVYHQYSLHCATPALRTRIQAALEANGISSMIYYPGRLRDQPAMAPYLTPDLAQTPVAQEACMRVLSLPISAYLRPEDQERIISTIRRACTMPAHDHAVPPAHEARETE